MCAIIAKSRSSRVIQKAFAHCPGLQMVTLSYASLSCMPTAFSSMLKKDLLVSQTTSGSDGTLRVWDVSNSTEQEPICIKVLDGIIAVEEPECETQCEAVWHPTGKYLVIGTKTHGEQAISSLFTAFLILLPCRNSGHIQRDLGKRGFFRERRAQCRGYNSEFLPKRTLPLLVSSKWGPSGLGLLVTQCHPTQREYHRSCRLSCLATGSGF